MMHESPEVEPTFGYLSAVQSPEHGYFGGYLIISALGRPLEFHCTAPVLPSRAQEILYGPTLHAYLVGDQIGATLLSAAKLAPRLVLTNRGEMVGLRCKCRVPMVLLIGTEERQEKAGGDLVEASDSLRASGQSAVVNNVGHLSWGEPFTVGNQQVQLPLGYESDGDAILKLLALLSERVELGEPFDRIHEAIREAQRIGGRDPEAHTQAA